MSEVLMAALGVQVKSLGRQLAEVTAKNAALTEENARVRALLTEFDQRHAADQAELAALRRAPVSAGKVKAIAEAAIRDCEAGAPISAANLARDILSALQPGDGWQDISSAPKDGTWFLAFIAELGLGSIRYVHFADAYDRFPINADSRCWSRAPTHWAPLPASLTGETQG